MHVRRTILCLATIFFWAAHDPDMASGQSSELMEANNRVTTLYRQGRYSEAEPYAKEALRLGTEEFGPNDPSTAVYLNNLAELYRAQGHYAEAEPLYQRALAIREKALGPEHPDVAESLNNMAELYRAQGHYAEAEPLYQRSLAIRVVLLRKSGEHLLQQEVFYGTRDQVYDGVQARGGSPGADQWPATS